MVAAATGRFVTGARMLALGVCVLAQDVRADAVSDFYSGKTVTITVGSNAGGSYDLSGRVTSRFLGKFIPGNPAVVVQNMPGASHVRAEEYLANIAPRDGTALAFVQPSVVLNAITEMSSAHYNPANMSWIGRLNIVQNVGFSLTSSGVTSVEDAKTRPLVIGSAGSTGPAAMVPWALNRMVGAKFKVVRGYADDTAEFIAVERAEIHGMGSANYASVVRQPGWLDKGIVKLLYTISDRRLKGAPEIPTIAELVDAPRDKAVMGLIGSIPGIGITIQGAPNIPADRLAALRDAAWKMFADAEFIGAMRELEMDVEPQRGEDLAGIVAKAMATPREVVEALKVLTAPMD